MSKGVEMRTVLLFALLAVFSVSCRADPAIDDLMTPEPLIMKNDKMLAMLAAYERFKIDQKSADISKLTVVVITEGKEIHVGFSYWPPPFVDGKGLVNYLSPDHDSEYGKAVAYVVDSKTNEIIKSVYQK